MSILDFNDTSLRQVDLQKALINEFHDSRGHDAGSGDMKCQLSRPIIFWQAKSPEELFMEVGTHLQANENHLSIFAPSMDTSETWCMDEGEFCQAFAFQSCRF